MLREVENLLEKGRAVGSKPLREYMEVKGYGDAAAWVYREAMGASDPGSRGNSNTDRASATGFEPPHRGRSREAG